MDINRCDLALYDIIAHNYPESSALLHKSQAHLIDHLDPRFSAALLFAVQILIICHQTFCLG